MVSCVSLLPAGPFIPGHWLHSRFSVCPLLVEQRASDSSKCVCTGGWGWSEEMALLNVSVPLLHFPCLCKKLNLPLCLVHNSVCCHFGALLSSGFMLPSACFPHSFSRPSLGFLHCSNGCPLRPAFGCAVPPLPHPHLSLEMAYQSLHCHNHKGPGRNSCPCHSASHQDQETGRGHEPSLLLRL